MPSVTALSPVDLTRTSPVKLLKFNLFAIIIIFFLMSYLDYLSYDEKGGLGIMPAGWVLDTHFSERGREGRLIRFGTKGTKSTK